MARLLIVVAIGACASLCLGEQGVELPTAGQRPKLDTGIYYPSSYYSRAYIQDFQLQPGEHPLTFRLRPFRHYGRYEHGYPIEPGLTDGTVQSDRFPYRYKWDFQPTQLPPEAYPNPCDDPLARRYEDLSPGRRESGRDSEIPPPPAPRPLIQP